jgi:hypothetical protein
MQEIWKDIKALDNKYLISNMGKIRSYLHKNHNLSTHYNNSGYEVIVIKKKHFSIHRLVAEAFVPNPNNYVFVNHIDGNKHNNKFNNLEWCTKSYNEKEAYRLGLKTPTLPNLGKTGILSARSKKVYQFNKEHILINCYNGVREASRKTNILSSCISDCCRGVQKTAGGYIWKYTI